MVIMKNTFYERFFFKQLYLFVLVIIMTSCISKTEKKDELNYDKLTTLTFKEKINDLGKLQIGKKLSTQFEFSNSGENMLIIKKVNTSCGCTAAKWSAGIIQPDEKGTIKIVYDAKYPGHFNKTITVFYNGKDSPVQLNIKGEVPYPKKKSQQ